MNTWLTKSILSQKFEMTDLNNEWELKWEQIYDDIMYKNIPIKNELVMIIED